MDELESSKEGTASSEGGEASSPETPPATDDPRTAETAAASEVLVEVSGLTKHYGPIKAVDGISFEVHRGDVLAFLGPNGAGKTTAMKMITGFLEPDEGRIRLAGYDMARDSLLGRKKLGYLPENAPAYGEMTVTGFLDFVAEARLLSHGATAVERVMETTGLVEVRHQNIDTLSKGYKRRVGLAQALIHDPEVLILDEPTDGLDPNQKAMVQDLISSLSSDKSIILSTHILDEAERICNRALILSQGKILVDSTPSELIAQAPNHNVVLLNTDADRGQELAGRLEAAEWCDRVTMPRPGTLEVYPTAGRNRLTEVLELLGDAPIHDIRLQEGRLDELFKSVTRGVAA